METILKIDGMSCENCEKHITQGIIDVQGIKRVQASLDEKIVVVQHNETVTLDMLKKTIENVGYEVVREEK